MRFTLNLKKIISALPMLFLILFYSCHRQFAKDEKAQPEIIIITQADSTTGNLTLRDANGNRADTFKVSRGRKIQWLLVAKETATDITNVSKKDTSVEVFSRLPKRLGSSSNWEGKVSYDAEDKTETYNIKWTDLSGDEYTYDPKIQVQ